MLKSHTIPFFYKKEQFEDILEYCQNQYKLEKHIHYYVKGKPSKSFAYWNPKNIDEYKVFCAKYKIQRK